MPDITHWHVQWVFQTAFQMGYDTVILITRWESRHRRSAAWPQGSKPGPSPQTQFCLTPDPCPLHHATLGSELQDSALNWLCDFGQVTLPLWASVSPFVKDRGVISVFSTLFPSWAFYDSWGLGSHLLSCAVLLCTRKKIFQRREFPWYLSKAQNF